VGIPVHDGLQWVQIDFDHDYPECEDVEDLCTCKVKAIHDYYRKRMAALEKQVNRTLTNLEERVRHLESAVLTLKEQL
jgi:hypothetical protein